MNGGARLSPSPDGYAGARLLHVVSVRFGDEELRRVRALAVIFATTPNTVIREACSLLLPHKVSTPGYHQAVEACRRTSSGDGAW